MNERRLFTFALLVSLALVSGSPVAKASAVSPPVSSVTQARRVEGANAPAQHGVDAALAPDFGKLPLSFVPNAGQTDPAVRFQVRNLGGTLFFTPGEVVLSLPTPAQSPDPNMGGHPGPHRDTPTTPPAPPTVVRLRFEGANPVPEVTGARRLSGIVNYLMGNDPTKWRTNLPTYASIVYRELYPGIDLYYGGTEGLLKGTYTVAPGADPTRIRWRYDGATSVRVDEATGDLLVQLVSGTRLSDEAQTLAERAPVAWQEINGQRISVSVRYVIAGDGSIGFALGDYDPAHRLLIDPTLMYSTYFGGSDLDDAYGIAVDGAGNAYIIGRTLSTDFPTQGAMDGTFNGGYDVFVAKLNAAGNALVYSTYLGGSSDDESSGIAVDSKGNVYATGYTQSADFPTHNPLDGTLNGISDIFVAKLNAAGNALVYSTYLGGSNWEYSYGIAVDSERNAYIAGATGSSDFPTHKALDETLDGGSDATVTKLNAAGNALVYSTYLGGSSGDAAYGGIAVYVPTGDAYVTGYTQSSDFPTQNPLDGTLGGTTDAFVAKLEVRDDVLVALVYSTYLGGSNSERSLGIAADRGGNVYVTGYTYSADFPTQNPLDGSLGGTQDAFVTKLNPAGSALLYSTYLGGSGLDAGEGIAVDNRSDGWGDAYVTGYTRSTDFLTTTSALDGNLSGTQDAFVTKLNAAGSSLLYSTYLGGSDDDGGYSIAVYGTRDAYVTGWTESTDFPTRNPLQAVKAGPSNCGSYDLSCVDAFVAKIGEPDIGFRPNPGGYQFPNWGELNYSDYTMDDMRRMFGDSCVCYTSSGSCVSFRTVASQANTSWNRGMEGGHCYGMAVTSLRFFTGIDHPYDLQAGANTTYELHKYNARRNIAYYHVEQYVDPARAYLGQILQNTPSAILDQLRSAISGTASDPAILVMFGQCWDGANWVDAGHAVSPYAIEDQSNGVYRVRVYDNNAPDDTSRYAVINTADDTWSYNIGWNCGTWSGSAGTYSLGLVPISQIPEQPPCPSGWSGDARTASTLNETPSGQVWLSGRGHLLITDAQGRRIGYVDDQFVSEIPGAYKSIIIGGLEIAMEPIYTLPLSDTYTILLDGQTLTQTKTVAVTQFGPGYAVSVDGVTLGPTSRDRLTTAPDGTQLSYRNAVHPEATPGGDKEATLTLALDGVSEGNQLRVRDADVGFEQVVTLTADVEGGQLAFSNAQAGGGEYALEIKRVSAAGEQGFIHASVAISATDTHYVEYGAWDGSGPMTLHVDHGSDGTTDETLELQNQAHHIYLPLIMRNYTPAVTSPSYVHRQRRL